MVMSPERQDAIASHLQTALRAADIDDERRARAAEFARKFVTPLGYFDRKVLVRFPNGQVGEVQMWHPDMLRAEEKDGHRRGGTRNTITLLRDSNASTFTTRPATTGSTGCCGTPRMPTPRMISRPRRPMKHARQADLKELQRALDEEQQRSRT
jgi:hypothetical protein